MGLARESEFHVLAVDDSIIDRKLIEKLLKTLSYQVTTVDSGTKALEFLGLCEEQIKPDIQSVSPPFQQVVEVNLIITDYCMPGMTGYDLLKKIKESSSLRNIPVVIMSSENVPSRITRCLEEGAEEFFLKPVSPSDVNKLKPHMMKTKQFQKHQVSENQENSETPHMMKTKQFQKHHVSEKQESSETPQLQQDQKQLIEDHQQQSINNKRKTIEEGLSPDRTRPRYNDITVVSN